MLKYTRLFSAREMGGRRCFLWAMGAKICSAPGGEVGLKKTRQGWADRGVGRLTAQDSSALRTLLRRRRILNLSKRRCPSEPIKPVVVTLLTMPRSWLRRTTVVASEMVRRLAWLRTASLKNECA